MRNLLKENVPRIHSSSTSHLFCSLRASRIWAKIRENSLEVLTADDFEGDDGQIYSDMFFKDYTYWMSSRCVYANSDIAAFCVSSVYSGFVNADVLYISGGRENSFDYAFRPVITLNSNVQVTSGNGTESTPFEIK